METLNTTIRDKQTNKLTTLNDFSIGEFDVTCSVGTAFKNRQQEAVEALLKVGALIPGLIESSADVLLRNINAPGINLIADRVRAELWKAGRIPEDQWTEDETEQAKEEIERLEAEQEAAGEQGNPIEEAVVADALSQIKQRDEDSSREFAEFQLSAQKQQEEFLQKQEELEIKRDEQNRKNYETTIKALESLTEAWSKGITGPPTIPTVDNQARLILDAQEEVSGNLPTNSTNIPEPGGQ